jgi:hypothetical protein
MKLIPLSQGLYTKVDDSDYDFLNQWKWFSARGYAVRNIDFISPEGKKSRRQLRMNRFLLNVTSDNLKVDHIDHDTLNNQRNNLRIGTQKHNCSNTSARKNTTSKYLGVALVKKLNKWRAKIQNTYLGTYNTEIEAAMAYDKEAISRYGEWANLNFPYPSSEIPL